MAYELHIEFATRAKKTMKKIGDNEKNKLLELIKKMFWKYSRR